MTSLERPARPIGSSQGWLFTETSATFDCPLDFRADIIYGIDGSDKRAFANDLGCWDFDNGFGVGLGDGFPLTRIHDLNGQVLLLEFGHN